ncbi:rho guanine nucleotide exchange factor 33 isoform X2 [Triplophysa dalaica]|uniref:rho guanine nucleotide exchange factor 33 isoform X2 n=1 Tax=Triplophysa dalaica TaxID=1582913 RepID=UPI0024DF7346|nr:rho guanine nucleotide exchange factor 33 isoform X2 [Triplophysa dalaica]
MENGKEGDDMDAIELLQFKAMWLELKSGFGSVAGDVANLRQSYSLLEETVSTYQQDNSDKILCLRNTLNTLQEDISTALAQVAEVKSNQKDLHRDLDRIQVTYHRKGSRGEGSVDGHASLCSQTDLSGIQHYISSLSANQTQRQAAALELLESERLYVSYLSLLLKANITFNGSESINLKDKRSFPSSLRFLIQQHLELLHILQERVLKSHWQGIMGDVFLRLTSKEVKKQLCDKNVYLNLNQSYGVKWKTSVRMRFFHCQRIGKVNHCVCVLCIVYALNVCYVCLQSDFLDHYVSYLRELPECLTVISLFSSSKATLLESDITGDETCQSLYSLLLQPVQRIPEYHTLLQSLLQQTESEHPDYYLLLVCVQQLRSFTTYYSHLLQHNQELLTHNHALREHTHNLCTHQQERPSHSRKELSRSTVRQLYKVDHETSKNYSITNADPSQGLRRNKRYPDYEASPYNYDPEIPSSVSLLPDSDSRHKPVSVPLRSIPEREGAGSALAENLGALLSYGGGDARCSSPSHSSDSSIDIAFVQCSPSNSPPHQSQSRGRSSGGAAYRSNRSCVSPDSADSLRPHPLQAVQRKSKSLNGLQMDSVESHTHHMRNPAHPKLERQSSGKTRLRPSSPKHRYEIHTDLEDQPRSMHQKDTKSLVWEDLKLKGVSDDYDHTPLGEQSRKEAKGFRNSFKKLFKKKSSDGKEKTTVKAECASSGDVESNRVTHTGDIDRGTAV